MKIKKIYYSLQTIFDILLAKNLYLINSPQNYLSLLEYLKVNNIKDNKVKIIAGFPSDNSIRQIQKIHSSEIGIKNELVFLKERFDGKFFNFILKILKRLKINKSLCIVGDKKYVLFKALYQGTLKAIFLDDGLNLLTFNDHDLKVKDYKLFSYFDLNTKKLIKNDFSFLKTKVQVNNVSNNNIWLLGSPAATFGIFDKNTYNSIIKKFAEKFNDKNIFFFPHRDEKFDKINFPKNIIINKNISEPIELYTSKQKTMPFLIAGFYTTALHILGTILNETKIILMNINFNTNLIKTNDLKERYNFEDFRLVNLKEQYNLVKKVLEKNNIENFF
jgi:hypothetical protein